MHSMYLCPHSAYYVDVCIMKVQAMCFPVSLRLSILRGSYSGGLSV